MKSVRNIISGASIMALAVISLSGCGSWWASTSVGPDLYVGDYYPTYTPAYNPNYYPGYWNPNYSGPIYVPSAPATPPPPQQNRPVIPNGNPGSNNGGNPSAPNSPSNGGFRPQVNPNGSVGSPSQGGFRAEQNGSNSRH